MRRKRRQRGQSKRTEHAIQRAWQRARIYKECGTIEVLGAKFDIVEEHMSPTPLEIRRARQGVRWNLRKLILNTRQREKNERQRRRIRWTIEAEDDAIESGAWDIDESHFAEQMEATYAGN